MPSAKAEIKGNAKCKPDSGIRYGLTSPPNSYVEGQPPMSLDVETDLYRGNFNPLELVRICCVKTGMEKKRTNGSSGLGTLQSPTQTSFPLTVLISPARGTTFLSGDRCAVGEI